MICLLPDYESDDLYMGAIVGRVAGRIAGAQFSLDDSTYILYKNDGLNTNHGGKVGFNKVIFMCLISVTEHIGHVVGCQFLDTEVDGSNPAASVCCELELDMLSTLLQSNQL